MPDKNGEIGDLDLDKVDEPTNECTLHIKNVLTNLENLLAKGCGNAMGGPCHRKDLGKDQHT